MATATTEQQTQAPAARTELPPVDLTPTASVDFDTRLMLTSVYMDVVLSGCDGVQEARQQAADAIAAAGRYSAEATRYAAVTAQPETYTSSRILATAADIIRSRGWVRYDWTREDGAVCALQAIRLAAGGANERSSEAGALLLERIRQQTGERFGTVPAWNDRRERTVADVLHLLG